MMIRTALTAAAVAVVTSSAALAAPISFTGGTFTETFNDLPQTQAGVTTTLSATTGTQAEIPGEPGFVGTRVSGSSTVALPFTVSDGSANSGALFSLGTTLLPADRALGTLASGSNVPAFGAQFVNNTSETITGFTLNFNQEEYRPASSTVNVVRFAFATSDTAGVTASNFLTASGFTNVDSGNLISTVLSPQVVPTVVVGTPRTVSIPTGLDIAPGESIFIRFTDTDEAGSDAALAIDDLSFTAVPEPTSLALLGLGGLALVRRRRA